MQIIKHIQNLEGKTVNLPELNKIVAELKTEPKLKVIYRKMAKVVNICKKNKYKDFTFSFEKSFKTELTKVIDISTRFDNIGCLDGIEEFTLSEANELGIIDGLGKLANKDIYKQINAKLLTFLKKDDLKFRQAWRDGVKIRGKAYGLQNYVTQSPYKGINAYVLNFINIFNGTNYQFYLTLKQIKERGGELKRDAEGITVWAYIKKETEVGETPEGKKVKVTEQEGRVYYTVYPLEHTTGVKPIKHKEAEGDISTIIVSAQTIIDKMPKLPIIKNSGDRAFYSPSGDYVQMPFKKAFNSIEEYYSTLFHELVHSTGNEKRIGRKFGRKFGDSDYAFEELIAELGAAYLCGVSNISYFTLKNSAAYLKSWSSSLRSEIAKDKTFFFRAVLGATKAAKYIVGETIVKNSTKKPGTKPGTKAEEKPGTTPGTKPSNGRSSLKNEKPTNKGIESTPKNIKVKAEGKNTKVPGSKAEAKNTKVPGSKAEAKNQLKLELKGLGNPKKSKSKIKQPNPNQRILNIFEINSEIAEFIKIPKASVFLLKGNEDFGLVHIALSHSEEIKQKYKLYTTEFCSNIGKNVAEIRKGKGNRYLLVSYLQEGEAAIIEFSKKAKIYSVISAYPMSKNKLNKFKLLYQISDNLGGLSSSTASIHAVDSSKEETMQASATLSNKAANIQKNENKKVVSASELSKMQYDALPFTGDWKEFLGNPPKNFKLMIYGEPGFGKSTLCLRFANYLKQWGKVLFATSEEFGSPSLGQKCERLNINGIDFCAHINDANMADYDFIFIDSINDMDIKYEDMRTLVKETYPNKSFIPIVQSTKDGNFKGGNDWPHLVDIVVEGYKNENGKSIAKCKKNRYMLPGTSGEIDVFNQN